MQIGNAQQLERTAATQAAAAGSRLALAAGAGARGFLNMVQQGRRSSRGSADGRQSGDAPAQPQVRGTIVAVETCAVPYCANLLAESTMV